MHFLKYRFSKIIFIIQPSSIQRVTLVSITPDITSDFSDRPSLGLQGIVQRRPTWCGPHPLLYVINYVIQIVHFQWTGRLSPPDPGVTAFASVSRKPGRVRVCQNECQSLNKVDFFQTQMLPLLRWSFYEGDFGKTLGFNVIDMCPK